MQKEKLCGDDDNPVSVLLYIFGKNQSKCESNLGYCIINNNINVRYLEKWNSWSVCYWNGIAKILNIVVSPTLVDVSFLACAHLHYTTIAY